MHDILDIVMINTIRMDDILSISNLHKHYVRNGFFGKKLPPVKAVDGISFSIKPGNVLVTWQVSQVLASPNHLVVKAGFP